MTKSFKYADVGKNCDWSAESEDIDELMHKS